MAKLNFNDAIQEKAQEYLASKDGDKKTVETKNTETKLSPLRKSLRDMDFSNKDADGSFQIGGMFGNESVSENIKKTEEQIKNNPNYNEETGKFGGEVSVGGKTVAQNEAPKVKGTTAEEEFDAGYFKEGGKSADTLMSEWLQAGKNGGQALAELEKLYAKNGQPVSDKAYEAFVKYFKSDLDAIKNAGLSDYLERNKDKSKTDDIDSLKNRALKETSEMGTYLDKALEGMSDKAKERYDKLAKTARGLIDGVNEDYAENLPKGYYGEYNNLKDYYLNHGYDEKEEKKKAGAQTS